MEAFTDSTLETVKMLHLPEINVQTFPKRLSNYARLFITVKHSLVSLTCTIQVWFDFQCLMTLPYRRGFISASRLSMAHFKL